MPIEDETKVVPITEEGLKRMPKIMARRLRPALRQPEIEGEFWEWISDMGYAAMVASPLMRQMLFESFVGGWGAKTRQLKRRKAERNSK